jgi:hypothetical protein
MRVEVRWTWVDDEASGDWNQTHCLYAFTDPESDEILYVNSAIEENLRDRCESSDHDDLWRSLRGIGVENVGVLIGLPRLDGAQRRDPALLRELTTLLINELDPSGNAEDEAGPEVPVRAGLEVACAGEWPYEEAIFVAL